MFFPPLDPEDTETPLPVSFQEREETGYEGIITIQAGVMDPLTFRQQEHGETLI